MAAALVALGGLFLSVYLLLYAFGHLLLEHRVDNKNAETATE